MDNELKPPIDPNYLDNIAQASEVGDGIGWLNLQHNETVDQQDKLARAALDYMENPVVIYDQV